MKFALFFAATALVAFSGTASGEDLDRRIGAPQLDPANAASTETVVLAGGCFWGQQAVFEHVKGVSKVVAGYSGGAKATATYPQVTTESTGHAESVEITFDPRVVSFGKLLQVYFSVAHDPTELNYQGPDEGSSYRSEIFFSSVDQEKTARAYIAQLQAGRVFSGPIVTKVEKLKGFYPAEAYHQDYLIQHPTQPYIVYNDLPKLEALKRVWPEFYRPDPVRLASR
ncbi:MAG TPA: peptide-methionine (S)-S-oxide reductase MsrA [Rhizomicrobium sp.]|jgi:peptide-methionine (S)-S-oxide reductase|nr:peptide-methionine (S)-S-oxide reductase MsrA [Rhizomicrobium sp.]